MAETAPDVILSVRDVSIERSGRAGPVELVRTVSFDVPTARTLALIGESGAGKSLTAMSVLSLLPRGIRVSGGQIVFGGDGDLLALPPGRLRRIRGQRIGMIFQNPMNSLNPTVTVGDQVAEARVLHLGESRKEGLRAAVGLLDRVGIASAARRARDYPHSFSGGMLQRAMIAVAISCNPDLLIADEPTTALDVTIQAQILELLGQLRDDTGMALLLVTHDLGVVSQIADEVAVMYAGEIVERNTVTDLVAGPSHPYTTRLLESVPQGLPAKSVLPTIEGIVPPAGRMPGGCRFHPRCSHTVDACTEVHPDLVSIGPTTSTRCSRVVAGDLVPTEVGRHV